MTIYQDRANSVGRLRTAPRMARRGFPILASIALALGGCEAPPSEVTHPTPENLPPEGSPMLRGSGPPQNLSADRLALWSAAKVALLQASASEALVALGRHGEMGDASLDIFGSLIYAAMDPEGTLFVLDRQNHAVKVFDRNGNAITSFGRAGQGPAEFRSPSRMERLPDGRIAVVDRGRRVSFFAPSESGYVHTTAVSVDRVPERACSAGGRMWVSGWDEDSGTAIREVEVAARSRSTSFGRGYRSDYWLVRGQMSKGDIACLDDPARVVFAFENIPVIEAYDADEGKMIWSAGVEDWLQSALTEVHEGRPQPSMEGGGGTGDYSWGMKTLPNDFVLYQVLRGDEAGESYEVRTYLVDALSGEGALVSVDLPIVLAVGPDRIVLGWLLPFARLEVRPFEWGAATP